MNKIKVLLLSLFAAVALSFGTAQAIPWSNVNIQNVSGTATPSPTAFATSTGVANVMIDLMTGNQTLGALTGGIAGNYYTLVFVQDGTGGRTLTAPASLTGMPAAIPTGANQWTVCIAQATSATAFVVPGYCYDNYDLTKDPNVSYSQALANTAVANTASLVQASVVAPGMTAAIGCHTDVQNPDANYQKGLSVSCLAGTNFFNTVLTNAGAATITPTAATATTYAR